MCESFTAIGQGRSEIYLRKLEAKTSAVKHKTAGNYPSAWPNK